MSLNEPPELAPESDLEKGINGLQKNFPSHVDLPDDERLRNDIGSNITIIRTKAATWGEYQNYGHLLDDFFKKSFKRLSEFYTTDEEKKVLNEYLETVIERSRESEEAKGRPPLVSKLFREYSDKLNHPEELE